MVTSSNQEDRMNLIAAFQGMIPKAGPPRSGVDAIVAGVVKAPELVEAERDFAENEVARRAVAKRLAEIFERLINSPLRRPLFATERDQIEVERADLNRKVDELSDRARQLQHEIANLMPAYARSVASALAGFRSRAANKLLDSVSAAEEALEDIKTANKALAAVGMSPPQALALPYAKALRNLADKILTETLHNG
jgi:hypothetical protein